MKKDLKKLRHARAEKAKAGKIALDQLNALLGKDNATDAEKAQITTLEGQVDALEAEVAALDGEISAEEKAARRATLFSTSSLGGGPALATIVNDTDPARTAGFRSLAEFAVAVRNLQVNGVGSHPAADRC
ncbi:outer membrane murein-binding lipoprotein Lpp [Bradyrhizobium japonicum]|nr:outer membrane murein-binding lipoprotein Lpp [Bradyrhizobium japonicum]